MSNGEAGGIATRTKPGNVIEKVFSLKKCGTPKATLNSREAPSSLEAREDRDPKSWAMHLNA